MADWRIWGRGMMGVEQVVVLYTHSEYIIAIKLNYGITHWNSWVYYSLTPLPLSLTQFEHKRSRVV